MTPAHVLGRYHQSLRNQLKRNNRSHRRHQTDGDFSIDTGLELAGVAGLFVEPSRYTTCTERVDRRGGVPAASPMTKSISFLRKGKRSTVDGFILRTFLRWNCSVFIMGDHDEFPC